MQVCLIRHGKTAGNLEHRYVGSTDEDLTAGAAEELKENRDRYPAPDCVFSSPLKRCVRTAELLFPGMQAEILPGLRECDFGEFEYKNYQELQGNADYQAWIDSNGTLPFPGGESREEFIRRCTAAFEEGCRRAEQMGCRFPAFVVHGGTIMAVLDRFSEPYRDYFDWQVKNGEGYVGELLREGFRLTALEKLPGPAKTGIEDQFVMKKNKKLRCGYTTGSCAAAAAKAAATMLLTGRRCRRVELMTPKGILLHLPLEEQKITAAQAVCAVRKYAGDDPDATDGILVYASAERLEHESDGKWYESCGVRAEEGKTERKPQPGQAEWSSETGGAGSEKKAIVSGVNVIIDGGIGVGRVTKPGLEQPVGAAAINRVPREMIAREVRAVCEEYEYEGRIKITISVPEGVEIAKKTFNPHIGIMGGISILGTSGIVVPMSEEALIASIRVEMKQKFSNGEQYLLITPGNYGADFIRRKELSQALDAEHSMKCSNYVGETLDMAVELGVKGILFVAHIGKFIKVSGGIMNTHSAHADCRAELMAAQGMRAGASEETVRELLASNTTEEAVGILSQAGLLEQTIREVTGRIRFHLQKRCQGALQTEVILFSNQYGYLGETDGAEEMMEKIIFQQAETSGKGMEIECDEK